MNPACHRRLELTRELMKDRGYDALILRNNPDLRWLTGAERTFDYEIAHCLVLTQTHAYLHTDSRYYHTFLDRLGDDSAFIADMDNIAMAEWVAARIAESKAHVVAFEESCSLGFYEQTLFELNKKGAACIFGRLHGDLCDLRMQKDPEELELMRFAQSVTDAAFAHICTWVRPGKTELEMRAELENYMLSHGADELSFGSIIASGPNGANPHALPSERVIQEGDMIVVDFGAAYRDYHSDMTRMISIGEPSELQRKVHEIVKDAHLTAAAAIKPGVTGAEIHAIAHNIIAEAGYGEYFMHGLGHGVGLEIHENPNLSPRWTRPLDEGSVVTVEPGIYLPGQFGVRIEDFGVVTAEGFKPFTQSSHELAVVAV